MPPAWTRDFLTPPVAFWLLAVAWLGSLYPWSGSNHATRRESMPRAVAHYERLRLEVSAALAQAASPASRHQLDAQEHPAAPTSAATGAPVSPTKFSFHPPVCEVVVEDRREASWPRPDHDRTPESSRPEPGVPPPRPPTGLHAV